MVLKRWRMARLGFRWQQPFAIRENDLANENERPQTAQFLTVLAPVTMRAQENLF